MLKILVKKQLMEVFRAYFYDSKKNQKRSNLSIAMWFLFFIGIMVGVLGGIFTSLAIGMCAGLTEVGLGWLYFAIMGGLAIMLGAFGSIFNTFAGLYLSKDNDLLLSMPIPAKYIIASRLINVYLMGAMYSAMAFIPALAVYFLNGVHTADSAPIALEVACGLLEFVLISLFVLVLSAVLGLGVAKISVKLKRKSFVTVLASLGFMGAYYFFYFKAQSVLQNIIANAELYGEKIKGSAYFIYLFGSISMGDLKAAGIYTLIVAVLAAAAWLLLKGTFFSITAATGEQSRVKERKRNYTQKTVFGTLLSKEFARFTSSPNYMLNCGLGIIFMPICGVALLIKGQALFTQLSTAFAQYPQSIPAIVCAAMFMMISMNDMAAPSISLEGKNIWVLQSMPIDANLILRAKTTMQIILTAVPAVFTLACAMIVVKAAILTKALICLSVAVYLVFSALLGMFLGIKKPNLSWTNELMPIKQSLPVFIAMFGGWITTAVFAGIYFAAAYKMNINIYIAVWAGAFTATAAVLYTILRKNGARWFDELN